MVIAVGPTLRQADKSFIRAWVVLTFGVILFLGTEVVYAISWIRTWRSILAIPSSWHALPVLFLLLLLGLIVALPLPLVFCVRWFKGLKKLTRQGIDPVLLRPTANLFSTLLLFLYFFLLMIMVVGLPIHFSG